MPVPAKPLATVGCGSFSGSSCHDRLVSPGIGFFSLFNLLCNLTKGSSPAQSWPPDFSFVPRLLQPFMETIYIAIIGTVVGGILAIPIAVLAAGNFTLGPLVLVCRRRIFMNILRTLPDLFWPCCCAPQSFRPEAGALALSVFTNRRGLKTVVRTLEGDRHSPAPEAVRSSGGNWLQMVPVRCIAAGLCRTTFPMFLYAFELNVRASMVLGLVGAGGIAMILEPSGPISIASA